VKINLRIEYTTGEEVEVTASASDLVAFESKFEIAVTKLEQDMKYTYLLWLAWHSLFRKKLTDKDFESWVDFVESVAPSDIDPKSKG
jgi:predicted 2-oxoglutarate/Fe(II)-dependent dioxygenase YbiX